MFFHDRIKRDLRRSTWPSLGTYGLVLCISLLLIYRRLLAGRVLANGDLHLYFFPYWTAASRAFQAGRIPLWSPYLFAGVPLLANSQLGVFYPLNWPFWLLSGPTLLGMTRALHGSVLFHVLLAGVNVFVLARQLGIRGWGAALSGLLYAGSGFLGVHVEHLNQLQGLAWLPLVLLPPPGATLSNTLSENAIPAQRLPVPRPVNILALAMILLAGHTQTAFITVLALLVWRLALAVLWLIHKPCAQWGKFGFWLGIALMPFSISGLLAAVQLLPTLELSRWSMRRAGLPWREAVSFSIRPWDLPQALLPPYLVSPLLPEGVAYLGLLGAALAVWGAWRAWRLGRTYAIVLIVLCGAGIFLAVGGYNPLYLAAVRLRIPGLVHFRAPARYLTLYVLAASLLAGWAISTCMPFKREAARVFGYGLVFGELLLASTYLPHAQATVPRTYTDLRPATAHLVAATQLDFDGAAPPGRFLSISKTLFDAGDEVDMDIVYAEALSDQALWAYKVAAKHREILSPNLSLAFEVPAVDGYDGGVLPLQHYVAFSRLLLPEGTLDGRLRENLTAIPPSRWLSLLHVRFLVTDKTHDAWVDGIFYDRQFQPVLVPSQKLELAWLPADFEADALSLLYTGAGELELHFMDGRIRHLPLPLLENDAAPYIASWSEPGKAHSVTLRASEAGMTLTGASLVDGRTSAFYPLVLSDHFRLVHSGDVKIYENLRLIPRAFFVSAYQCVDSEDEMLQALAYPEFDPTMEVVLACQGRVSVEPAAQIWGKSAAEVRFVHYTDTQIVLDVTAEQSGFLVLTDTWYPGWSVAVVNREAGTTHSTVEVPLRADVLFRAVPLQAGNWRLTFTFVSTLMRLGYGLCGCGGVACLVYALLYRKFFSFIKCN